MHSTITYRCMYEALMTSVTSPWSNCLYSKSVRYMFRRFRRFRLRKDDFLAHCWQATLITIKRDAASRNCWVAATVPAQIDVRNPISFPISSGYLCGSHGRSRWIGFYRFDFCLAMNLRSSIKMHSSNKTDQLQSLRDNEACPIRLQYLWRAY